MMRKFMVAFLIMLAMLVSSQSFAESSYSKSLLDKLYDVKQITKTGITFEKYSAHIDELSLIWGRFERERKGIYSTSRDRAMKSATENYINARDIWSKNFTLSPEDINEQQYEETTANINKIAVINGIRSERQQIKDEAEANQRSLDHQIAREKRHQSNISDAHLKWALAEKEFGVIEGKVKPESVMSESDSSIVKSAKFRKWLKQPPAINNFDSLSASDRSEIIDNYKSDLQ